jgi:two-component system chemotaxis response regulator CheY
MKILIVDDEITTQELLKMILQPYGECDIAQDGVEALKAFNSSDDPYDLILLDIMMPRQDGHEVLKNIRRIENARGIYGFEGVKVIMVTALDDLDNIKKAYDSYCISYLVKPISQEKILKELENLNLVKPDSSSAG